MTVLLLALTSCRLFWYPERECPDGQYVDLGGGCASFSDLHYDTGSGCPDKNELAETVPENGARDAYYRADLEFGFSEPVLDPEVELLGPEGHVGGTTWVADNGDTVRYTPDEPLVPSADYAATISWGDCAAVDDDIMEIERVQREIAFQTSSLGEPLAADLAGRTWEIELAKARFVEPPGIGAVLASQLTQSFLVGVTGVREGELDLLLAVSIDGRSDQDLCQPTVGLVGSDFSASPFVTAGPTDAVVTVAGYPVQLRQLVLSSTFSSDGAVLGGVQLSALADTRDSEKGDEGYVCEIAIGFGAECEACPDDGEHYCLRFLADQITANELPVTLVNVAPGECNPGCEPCSDTGSGDTGTADTGSGGSG